MRICTVVVLFALLSTLGFAAEFKKFAVSTQGKSSTEAALRMQQQGGNLVDAAVAASFAIAVERPQGTGIGGGGFLLFHNAKLKKTFAIDFRERGPLQSNDKMFLDKEGNVVPYKTLDGIFAVAVPGMIKGLLEVHRKWGSLPLEKIVAPAIEVAEKGFAVYPHLAHSIVRRAHVIRQYPASAALFLRKDGSPLQEGDILVQKDLAKTLREIVKTKGASFYSGKIRDAILAENKRLHGILTAKDFTTYTTKWREPIRGNYKGYDVVSMPPPSSGGTHVIQILNILERNSLKEFGFHTAKSIHLMASAMQRAFADRATFMGDPEFVKVPVKELISKKYAERLRASIDLNKATPSDEIRGGKHLNESTETTHLSLMDAAGNVIVSTQTINGWMGSGVVVPGTGILLNNQMDDFSTKPGASNLFGAIGSTANLVAPKKTPLSSMSPTIIFKNGKPVLAVGAPGGTRIITCVAQTILNYLEFGLSLYDSVAKPRFHHQWMPDELHFDEPGPSPAVQEELRKMGYKIEMGPHKVLCHVMAVAREGDHLIGVSDPRDIGVASGL